MSSPKYNDKLSAAGSAQPRVHPCTFQSVLMRVAPESLFVMSTLEASCHPGTSVAGPAVMDAFDRAGAACVRHWDDPNWSRLAWGRHLVEEEAAVLGRDPWANGLSANHANLERFITYSHEQGLIGASMPVEGLFAEATLGILARY